MASSYGTCNVADSVKRPMLQRSLRPSHTPKQHLGLCGFGTGAKANGAAQAQLGLFSKVTAGEGCSSGLPNRASACDGVTISDASCMSSSSRTLVTAPFASTTASAMAEGPVAVGKPLRLTVDGPVLIATMVLGMFAGVLLERLRSMLAARGFLRMPWLPARKAPAAGLGVNEPQTFWERVGLAGPLALLKYRLMQVFKLPLYGKVIAVMLVALPIITIGGILLHHVTGLSWGEAIQQAYFVLNNVPGCDVVNEDKGRVVLVGIHLASLFTFAGLVGLFTEDIGNAVTAVRNGNFAIPESGHTVVIGGSSKLVHVLREIMDARAKRSSSFPGCLAVLSPEPKEELDQYLLEQLGEARMANIVTRQGCSMKIADLERVAAGGARSVIMLHPDIDEAEEDEEEQQDAGVPAMDMATRQEVALAALRTAQLKHMASLNGGDITSTIGPASLSPSALPSSSSSSYGISGTNNGSGSNGSGTTTSVVSMMQSVVVEAGCDGDDEGDDALARDASGAALLSTRAEGQTVTFVSSMTSQSRIAVQCALQPGLVRVFNALLRQCSASFYKVLLPPGMIGQSFGKVRRLFPEATLCGFLTPEGASDLNPPDDKIMVAGEALVALAHTEQQAARSLRSPAPTPALPTGAAVGLSMGMRAAVAAASGSKRKGRELHIVLLNFANELSNDMLLALHEFIREPATITVVGPLDEESLPGHEVSEELIASASSSSLASFSEERPLVTARATYASETTSSISYSYTSSSSSSRSPSSTHPSSPSYAEPSVASRGAAKIQQYQQQQQQQEKVVPELQGYVVPEPHLKFRAVRGDPLDSRCLEEAGVVEASAVILTGMDALPRDECDARATAAAVRIRGLLERAAAARSSSTAVLTAAAPPPSVATLSSSALQAAVAEATPRSGSPKPSSSPRSGSASSSAPVPLPPRSSPLVLVCSIYDVRTREVLEAISRRSFARVASATKASSAASLDSVNSLSSIDSTGEDDDEELRAMLASAKSINTNNAISNANDGSNADNGSNGSSNGGNGGWGADVGGVSSGSGSGEGGQQQQPKVVGRRVGMRPLSVEIIEPDAMLSGVLTQVAAEPQLVGVLEDLMDEEGCEVYLRGPDTSLAKKDSSGTKQMFSETTPAASIASNDGDSDNHDSGSSSSSGGSISDGGSSSSSSGAVRPAAAHRGGGRTRREKFFYGSLPLNTQVTWSQVTDIVRSRGDTVMGVLYGDSRLDLAPRADSVMSLRSDDRLVVLSER